DGHGAVDSDPTGAPGVFGGEAGIINEIALPVVAGEDVGVVTHAEGAGHVNVIVAVIERHEGAGRRAGDQACQHDGQQCAEVSPEYHRVGAGWGGTQRPGRPLVIVAGLTEYSVGRLAGTTGMATISRTVP